MISGLATSLADRLGAGKTYFSLSSKSVPSQLLVAQTSILVVAAAAAAVALSLLLCERERERQRMKEARRLEGAASRGQARECGSSKVRPSILFLDECVQLRQIRTGAR